MEVFGCEAVVFKPKIHHNGKMNIVRKQCIWVGRSRKILGGHRVMPVIWDPEAAEWRIEALEDVKKAEVHCGVFPLRTRQAKLLVGRQRTLKRLWTRWPSMLSHEMYTRHKK